MASRAVPNVGVGPGNAPPPDILFGRSAAMGALRKKVDKIAATNVPVLIQGENGTGKEVLARYIHANSPFCSGPFIKVYCAAIPGTLLESELFGYQKGAFTGAYASKPGRVELAENGSLLIDEISGLDMSLQAKVLQLFQDRQFNRIGDPEDRCVDTRLLCTTSRNLRDDIESARFRPDLFYRINVVTICLPKLRDRREDILPLAKYFLELYNFRFQRNAPVFSREINESLENWDWPGNIRELENRIARYVILESEDLASATIRVRTKPPAPAQVVSRDGTIPLKQIAKQAVREMERDLILKVLQANHWNRRKAAEILKISYRALLYKIRNADLAAKSAAQSLPGLPMERPVRLS